MAYLVQNKPDDIRNGQCSECGSKSFRYQQGKVFCLNCGHLIGNIQNSALRAKVINMALERQNSMANAMIPSLKQP